MQIEARAQSKTVEAEIESLLNAGETDKKVIYDKVVEKLGLPRPTVRRVTQGLIARYNAYLKILNPE